MSLVPAVVSAAAPAAAAQPGAEILGWGFNGDFELGNGTDTDSNTPGLVAPGWPVDTTFTDVAAGSEHGLARTSHGLVYAWGGNDYGQVGDGSTTSRDKPEQVLAGTTVASIAAGRYHSLALTSDHKVLAWGRNLYGALGDGTTQDSSTPVQVKGALADVEVTAIAAGWQFSLALTSDGLLYAWGRNDYGQLGDGTTTSSHTPVLVDRTNVDDDAPFTQIAAGASHVLATDGNMQLYTWGLNDRGQLGDGTTTNRHKPVWHPRGMGMEAMAIAAGESHSLMILGKGEAVAWGDNSLGQLGDGSSGGYRTKEVPVQLLSSESPESIVTLAGGAYHSLAMISDGTVYAWGHNGFGQLGDGATGGYRGTPALVPHTDTPAGTRVTAIAAGDFSNLAIGTISPTLDWGGGEHGQLGNHRKLDSAVPVEPALPAGVTASGIAAGYQHNLLTTVDGVGYAWGANDYGQLGDGSTTDRDYPVPMQMDAGGSLYDIAGGQYHSLAVADGEVLAWGRNNYGQLGDGTHTDRPQPEALTTLPAGITAVAAGADHSLALTSDWAVYAWGRNNAGQLGNGTVGGDNPSPAKVKGLEGVDVFAVAAGADHSLALTDAGHVYSWGSNSYGQLGNAGGEVATAVRVPGLEGITAIAAGAGHSLALASDGTVYSWGRNNHGQLGDGGTVNRYLPTPVNLTNLPADATVTAVGAGGYHSLAVTSDAKPYGWGRNDHGQVGDGTTVDRYLPVPVKLVGQLVGLSVTQVAGGLHHSLSR